MSEGGVEGRLHNIDLAIKEYGGFASAPEKKYGKKNRGIIKWTPFFNKNVYDRVKAAIISKLERLANSFGYRLVKIGDYLISPSEIVEVRRWKKNPSLILSKSRVI